jgi:hypothetical protein
VFAVALSWSIAWVIVGAVISVGGLFSRYGRGARVTEAAPQRGRGLQGAAGAAIGIVVQAVTIGTSPRDGLRRRASERFVVDELLGVLTAVTSVWLA